jgi:hypothetical protein
MIQKRELDNGSLFLDGFMGGVEPFLVIKF